MRKENYMNNEIALVDNIDISIWGLVLQDPEGQGLFVSHCGVGPWGSEPRSEVYQADRLLFGVPNP